MAKLNIIDTPAGKLQIMYWGGPYRLWLTVYKDVGGGARRYVSGNCIADFFLVRTAKGWQVPSRGERGHYWGTPAFDIQTVIPAAAKWAEQNAPEPNHLERDIRNFDFDASRFTEELRKHLNAFVGNIDALSPGKDRELARIATMAESLSQAVGRLAETVKESIETPATVPSRRAA